MKLEIKGTNPNGERFSLGYQNIVQAEISIINDEGDVIFQTVYPPPPLETPIENLELSNRATRLLKQEDITTVGELVQHTANDLLLVRSFGRKCLNEVILALEQGNFPPLSN